MMRLWTLHLRLAKRTSGGDPGEAAASDFSPWQAAQPVGRDKICWKDCWACRDGPQQSFKTPGGSASSLAGPRHRARGLGRRQACADLSVCVRGSVVGERLHSWIPLWSCQSLARALAAARGVPWKGGQAQCWRECWPSPCFGEEGRSGSRDRRKRTGWDSLQFSGLGGPGGPKPRNLRLLAPSATSIKVPTQW